MNDQKIKALVRERDGYRCVSLTYKDHTEMVYREFPYGRDF